MPSVTNDEADIYTSAYIFGRTLKDYYGNWGFLTTGILTAKPSLPIYIGAIPWFFTSIKSVILARLPFVLLNSISPVLLYSIIKSFKIGKRLPFLAFFVINFSPWFSYPSTTGYEAMVVLFFILLFFRITVSRIKMIIKIPLSLIIGFLAFNSYMGTKPVFPFILFIGFLFYLNVHKNEFTKKQIFSAIVFSIVTFSIFIGINYIAPNSTLVKREYQIMLNYYEKPQIEGKVWFERWTSKGPDKLIALLSNKFTIRLKDYASKYFISFNPQLFFQKGDPSSLYGTADLSGLFFITDFVFFILGLYFLSGIKNRGIYILLALFFVGGLPVALSNSSPTFILRGVILLIPYSILIAYGMEQGIKKWRYGIMFLTILFAINYALFITVYSVRITNLNGEQWKYTIKLISEKIDLIKNNYTNITIYNPEARETFFQYAFYNINDAHIIIDRMKNQNYIYQNIKVTILCPKKVPKQNELVVMNREFCGVPSKEETNILTTIEPLDRSGNDYYFFSGR